MHCQLLPRSIEITVQFGEVSIFAKFDNDDDESYIDSLIQLKQELQYVGGKAILIMKTNFLRISQQFD